MSRPRILVVAIATAALTGANIAQGVGILMGYWQTGTPASPLFRMALYGVWLPIAIGAAVAGLLGAFRLAQGRLSAMRWLFLFGLAFAFTLKVDGYELGWSFFRFAVNFVVERVGVGVNILGVVVLFWLYWTNLSDELVPASLSDRATSNTLA
jgi:hypothetical protein